MDLKQEASVTRINSIYKGTFWDNYWWYPESLSWELIEEARNRGHHLARPSDLFGIFSWMLVILIFRYVYEKFIGRQLAIAILGNLARRRSPEPNAQLEKIYLSAASKQTPDEPHIPSGWTPARVSTWYRRRRNMDRPDMVKKFSETSYRFISYCFLWGYGLWALHDKSWSYDTLQCWIDFPFQSLDWEIYFYYIIELAFYGTLVLSLFSDIKRKDFTEQCIHHVATITLMVFSYIANFTRVGTLVLVIHDISDIFLELAKLFLYAKKTQIADFIFTVFAVVFIVSRDLVYPYMVLHTTWVQSMWLFEPYFGYYAFNAFLGVIYVLNLFWTFTILKMAYKMSKDGEVEQDDRSDAEEYTDDEEENEKVKKKN